MRIVLTGATGLVGRALTRELLAAGYDVEAWTRSPEKADGLLPARCRVVAWNPACVAPERLAGAGAVVHLAGENVAGGRWTRRRKDALATSRIASARALVAAIASLPESERPKSLLSASAVGWYGDRGDEVLTESVEPGRGFLPDLCVDWEDAVREAEALGVRTASLRIGVVLGRDEGMLGRVLPLFRLGLGGRVGSGRQWMSWIHVGDVAALFRHVLERPDLRGPVNATAPEPVRNADFTRALSSAVGRPALLPAPAFALRLAFGEMASILTASQRVLPAAAQASGFRFRHPRLDEALADLCARRGHELVFEQRVEVPLAEAFDFFADPANLEKITPPFLNFAILSAPKRGLARGSRIVYRLRLHGIPIRWRTRIDRWDPPHGFVDVQESGPYALWHHTHELEALDARATLVRDRVRYRLPLGALGDVVAGGLVARDLDRIFRYRREQIGRLLDRRAEAA